MQQSVQELNIVEDSKEEQTLGARKESLIRKRKQLNVTNHKLTCVEKHVRFDLLHDQCISKHSRKAEKQNKVWDGNLKHRMACNKLLFLIKKLGYP